MTGHERQRRNLEIFAAWQARVPACEIAHNTGLTKRHVNRIVQTERAERHSVVSSRIESQDPAVSALQLLDDMERIYFEASYAAARRGSTGAVLVAPVLRMSWRNKRAALEQLVLGS